LLLSPVIIRGRTYTPAKENLLMKSNATVIVWNIEDVTPSINSTFIKGLTEYARSQGRISTSRVYGDWSRLISDSLSEELAESGFEMVNIPAGWKDRINLVMGSWLIDHINRNPGIDRLILISGDGALKPVVEQVRSHNLHTTIVCDARRSDEELLLLAEDFKDFRDLTLAPLEEDSDGGDLPSVSLEESFLLLQEAVDYIENAGGTPDYSTLKVRLTLMNEGFDLKKLGFASWQDYLARAQSLKLIKTRFREGRVVLSLGGRAAEDRNNLLPTVIRVFLQALYEAARKTITSEGKKAKLSDIRQRMKDTGIDYRRHGYSSLKKVADAAAKRGLVFVSLKGGDYLLDLTKRGSAYVQAEEVRR
jgi:hypothetical protein